MSTMADVMAALAATLTPTVPQVYDYPVESITVPCAVVGYPSAIDFDATWGNHHTWTVPVWYAVGKTGSDDARNRVSDAVDALRALLNAAAYETRVTGAAVTELVVTGVPYLAIRFDCEVYAP
jgi:hypothetical protein